MRRKQRCKVDYSATYKAQERVNEAEAEIAGVREAESARERARARARARERKRHTQTHKHTHRSTHIHRSSALALIVKIRNACTGQRAQTSESVGIFGAPLRECEPAWPQEGPPGLRKWAVPQRFPPQVVLARDQVHLYRIGNKRFAMHSLECKRAQMNNALPPVVRARSRGWPPARGAESPAPVCE
jgi:hypothetical protein